METSKQMKKCKCGGGMKPEYHHNYDMDKFS